MRIAALDDDPLQLEFFTHALTAMGHACRTYTTGAALLKDLRRETFDLLIVDWQLPDIEGPEIITWVRQQLDTELPILFVTHRQSESDIVQGLGCGADDFMVKPVRLAEFKARVGALLRRAYPLTAQSVLDFGPYRFLTAINGTQNALSTEAVDEAVHLMQEARQVFCLGQGGSMLLANDICARFASLSTKFRTAGDSHLQLLTASLMNEADVVLFVSYSGATRDMMETLRTAKAAGAKIILLTHYEDSPGALLADVVLLCGAQESPLDSGSIPIKVAVLYVAEVLVLRYILDDKPGSTEAQERTTEALAVKML